MVNKILRIIIFVLALAGLVSGIFLIPQQGINGWIVIAMALFFMLIAAVVFRKGVAGAVRSYHDGTPKGLR